MQLFAFAKQPKTLSICFVRHRSKRVISNTKSFVSILLPHSNGGCSEQSFPKHGKRTRAKAQKENLMKFKLWRIYSTDEIIAIYQQSFIYLHFLLYFFIRFFFSLFFAGKIKHLVVLLLTISALGTM